MRPTSGWGFRSLAFIGVVSAISALDTDTGWLYVLAILAIGVGTAFGWTKDSE